MQTRTSNTVYAAATMVLIAIIGGCGFKSDLYLPSGKPPPAAQPLPELPSPPAPAASQLPTLESVEPAGVVVAIPPLTDKDKDKNKKKTQ